MTRRAFSCKAMLREYVKPAVNRQPGYRRGTRRAFSKRTAGKSASLSKHQIQLTTPRGTFNLARNQTAFLPGRYVVLEGVACTRAASYICCITRKPQSMKPESNHHQGTDRNAGTGISQQTKQGHSEAAQAQEIAERAKSPQTAKHAQHHNMQT